MRFYVANEKEKTEFVNKIDEAKVYVNEEVSNVSNYSIMVNVLACLLHETSWI